MSSAIEVVARNAGANSLYVLHIGINDIQSTINDDREPLAKYELAIRRYKVKSNQVLVSWILPRIKAFAAFNEKPTL